MNENSEIFKEADDDVSFRIKESFYDQNVYIKSMKYPGFVNYFRKNSNQFGHLYFGYGLCNKDLLFINN